MKTHPGRILLAFLAVVAVFSGLVLAFGNRPQLGLDLKGGVSVSLEPIDDEGQPLDNPSQEALEQSKAIIERRVDALGLAEPEVAVQGNTVVVQLPGVSNAEEVLAAVGQTAELRFRPVLERLGQVERISKEEIPAKEAEAATKRAELGLPEGVTATQVLEQEQERQNARLQEQLGEQTEGGQVEGQPLEIAPEGEIPAEGEEVGGGNRSAGRAPAQGDEDGPRVTTGQLDATPTTVAGEGEDGEGEDGGTTTAPTTTVPFVPLNEWGVDVTAEEFQELARLEAQISASTVEPGEDRADQEVTLSDREGNLYRLGPTQLTGTALEGAEARLEGAQWVVNPTFKAGPEGIDAFNALAAQCFAGAPVCPAVGADRGALAIVLDGEVVSAPTINAQSFQRDQIVISGSFTRESANELAVALRYGALPLTLQARQSQTISPSIGEGALTAGIIAGAVGLGLVAIYLLIYYRLLGLVTLVGLGLSGLMIYISISALGATVTLAGVVGIIVSIGVSLDSSVVSFENLKEDVMNGATLRSSVERSFAAAYSTILKADISSLIGALILVWLSIGQVRGFATFLAISTVFDLTVAYFFLRPAVILLARKFGDRPGLFGIPERRTETTVPGAAEPALATDGSAR